MPELSEIFGEERLSYAEFSERAAAAGASFGDVSAARAEFENRIAAMRRSAALERELDRAKVKNREIVSKIIDMEKVTVGEEGVGGIAEQLESLRRTDPYLFEAESGPAGGREEAGGGEGRTPGMRFSSGMRHGSPAADPDSMSDAEFYRAVKKL